MKMTKKDLSLNQEKNITEVDNKVQQTESAQSVIFENAAILDTETQNASDQLNLPLEITETLAMVSDGSEESKKRKEKKEEAEKKAKAKQEEIADDGENDSEESNIEAEEASEGSGEEASEESLVSDALASQSSSGLSLTTIFVSAVGLFGAASFFRNSEKDSSPTITSGDSARPINENSGAGQVIYNAVAIDGLGETANLTYSLTEDSDGALTIDAETGEVTLTVDPDHEVKAEYEFTVIVGDDLGNQAQQPVKLVITNIDEIAPTITSGDTAASINENSGAGQVIYTATADDSADISDGFTFSLSSGSDGALTIDANTGEVTLTTDPDHEAQSQYSFAVIATDAVGNVSAAQSVTLDINDLDEIAPTITSGDTAASINENSGAGQVIYTATADDSADISDGFTFSLSADSDDALTIDVNTGEVTLTTDPDHETQSQYSFAVIATDAANNVSAAQSVTLDINDLDDAAPTITSGDTAASINENSGAGQVIYTATADDSADISDGVTFSLLPGSDAALSIDEITGQVTLNESPDFEAKSEYSFAVIATDAANNVSAAQSVTLDINDLDEIAPTITSGDTAASINENSGAGQVIYTATADDSADISDGFTFSLSSGSDGALTIDANTGEVTLTTDPDHEAQSQYSFAVIATDAANNVSAAQSVTLDINDLDEIAPTITSGDTAASINENSGAGQVIYTATADDSADISDGFTFSLSADSDDALTIDVNTGEVTLTTDPDHETQSQYSFAVIATDAANNVSAAQSVTLDINDLDDAAPTITSGDTAASINENSGAGQVIYTATADDSADISDGVTFSLLPGSDAALSIDEITGQVTLNESPDFEAKSEYSFAVIATDAANNVSAAQSVTLDINDLDEIAPTITSGDTAASINENSGAGQVIYTATADDSADISDGFTFSLSSGSDGALTIDANTGEVTLTTDPDHEAQSQYSFAVIATDAANNVSAAQSVTLDINDLDEIAPTITSGDTAASINENSGAGQVIYTATADDSADISDGFTFSLSADSDDALTIDVNTGEVTLTTDPDHETQSQYSFAVIATDAANNVSAAQSVTLDINDLDDAAPTITSGDTAASINENSGAGQVIYTATADDSADISDGVTFSLSADTDGALTIDANTGEVTLTTDPDHEAQSQYSFAVIATDAANNVSAAQSVTLDINDLDEIAPTITSGDTAASINENSGAGQVIYTATADDSADISDGFTFSLSSGSDGALTIDANTGEVTLTTDPDHEAQSQYSFAVIATDAANNVSAAQSVTLDINDLDEIAPTITSGDTAASINENSGAGQVIYTATADDSADISDGFTFSLSADSDDALTIDVNTGEVTLITDPDHEAQSQYSFAVIATDAANNVSASQSVTLDINDLDDTPPTITSSDIVDAISENTNEGQIIYVATADDSADVTSGPVTFSLSGDSDSKLSIDAVTGEVTLIEEPDHEVQTQYNFTVIATDGANNLSEKPLTLNVEDIDDVAPVFLSSSNETVQENNAAGQIIYTAVADDSLDVSDGVTFSLLPGSDAALSIDEITGQVTLNESPDFEAKSEYSFTVLAENNPNLGSVLQVVLTVNNVDDTAPTITSDAVGNINETNNAGAVIYTGVADDSADIESGSIVYSLTDSSDDGLTIDPDSGEVILTNNLDHEEQDQYNFGIIATDASGNESASQAVTVNLNDVDDTAPTITSSEIAAAIDENSGADQIIYTATADDTADVSDGFTFSLAPGSDSALTINADTGVVTLTTDPDHEVQSQYSFAVIATDAAGNPSDAKSVTLDINDLDDSAPIITSSDTATSVDEGTGAGQVIYTVVADDSADLSGSIAFSLAAGSDADLTIDQDTGEVSLSTDPDYVLKSEYSFAVIATDASGNASDARSVTLNVNDIDESAPTFLSSNTASLLESKVGNNIVYRAVVDDSLDISAGVNFQLNNDSDAGLSINAAGEVILTPVPNFETQSSYEFTVIADDGLNQAEQTVTLSIIDQDLDAPIFISLDAASVNENIGLNQVIYSAISQDEAIVSYSLADGHDDDLSIDSDSGDVTLATNPDHETLDEYSFIVVATDTSNNVTEQTVTVTINDLDDAAPTINPNATIPTIDENSGAGQIIYTATADDTGDDISGFVSFSIADGSDAGLAIDSVTGEVTITDNPDYETKSQYNFTVVATDEAGNQSEGQSVTLDISNIDDTAPTITSDVAVAGIDENIDAGQTIYTATAEDLGDNTDGLISFSLADGSDAGLSINELTGEVKLNIKPDYESKSEYEFTVLATDSEGNQGQIDLTLDINNIDEQPPVFTSLSEATILKNTTSAGDVVYRAFASDTADISAGITYSLVGNSAFSIDQDTGQVTINEDPVSDSSYSFTVFANDGRQAQTQSVTLDVVTQDLEDPVIISLDAASINENTNAGQVIYTAVSQDESVVSYSLVPGHDADLSIDSVTGEVTLSSTPDHEAQIQYSFTVVATDGAGNTAQKAVTVTVVDLDDADPVITSGETASSINENSGAGQLIYTAIADDSDDISDGVTFSLSNDSDSALIIDASNGQVFLTNDPDHENQVQYSFTVIATDAAGNISEGKSVTLDINNLDDTLPIITSIETVNAIDEKTGAGQVIYTASAEDDGDGSDGLVSFSLAEGSDNGLSIDAVSGEVTITSDPDYEAKDQYSFTIVATDTAGNQVERSLSLNINNIDESAPVFTSLANASVLESTMAETVVYRTLVDDSEDISAGVTFSLLPGSDVAFTINSETGEVTLNEGLDYADQSIYDFTVEADDGVNQSQQAVVLSVIDQDLEPPVFASATSGSIDENIGEGQIIYTALTNDESVVTYALTEDSDDGLTINTSTGEVTLTANPDHEAQSQYNFTVMASDTMGNESVPHTVTIDVINLDDTAAIITSSDTVAAIDENSGAGQVIYTAIADDSADLSDGITYALTDTSDSALSIDAASGQVTLTVDPNYEIQSQYSFAVIATDAAGNVSDEKPLTLNVNNLDDTAPIIISGSIAADLNEDTGVNQVIYTATADDSADVSGGVTFSLQATDASLSIDEVTGEVTLSENPSYLVKSSYNFTVIATDTAGNESAPQAATLNILETAPPVPVISLDSDTGSFADDSISQVGLVNVTELKDGASWEYSLDNGDNWSIGTGSTFTIGTEGVYQVKVRQTNASETFTTSMDNALEIQVDNSVSEVQSITADSDSESPKVIINYDEPLDVNSVPLISDYEVTRNGEVLVVDSIAINGSAVELAVSDLQSGSLQVKYTPSASPNLIKDLAGNELTDGFTQIIVSDGYIRGAQVFWDDNGNGIADALLDVTSDEFGQIILGAQYADSLIVVKGGVNMDSGASNELELTAPAGYAVINPLTTLVQEIVTSSAGDEDLSGAELEAVVEAAEQDVSVALGIELSEGEDLSTYDPLSDQSIDNQKVVAQIATVLAVASAEDEASGDDSSDSGSIALANLANIVTNSDGEVEIDADIVGEILSDGEDGSLVADLTRLTTAVQEMEEASDINEVVEAQALIIDFKRPNTPITELSTESNLGISNTDALTSEKSPVIRFTFDTLKNDGTAVVEGDTIEIFNTGITVKTIVLDQGHIDNGYVVHSFSDLLDGMHLVSASITDRAGNMSYVSNLRFEVDTLPLNFIDKAIELVLENAGAAQVIYQAEVQESDFWKFELSNDSDANVSINSDTGIVSIDHNPDYETQSSYNFTIIATDKAGAVSTQSVVGNIVNLDEIAPVVNSANTAEAINENGLSQVIYTATADDSQDVSDGVMFSLTNDSDPALSIDSSTGEVIIDGPADHEQQSTYDFGVIATDVAGNVSETQLVTLNINDLDDAAPSVNSGDSADSIDENSISGQVVYTATADDSADDVSHGPITFSLTDGSDSEFAINSQTGEVSFNALADHESDSQYSFAVIATDGAGNIGEAQTVTLNINDLDDAAPIVDSGDEANSVDENSTAGQIVYTATGDDSGDDISVGPNTFSLTDGSDSEFAINSETGEVSFNGVADHESDSQYSFAVIATDGAGNIGEAQSVTLNINDLDDSAPSVDSGDTANSVDENSAAGQVVYTATGDDSGDEISVGPITFSLTNDSDSEFSINSETGEVSFNAVADHESDSQYSFAVIATDGASNIGEAQSVTLNIGNVDDTPPTITSSSEVAVDENNTVGQPIYTATANDSADVENGSVTFSLALGSDPALAINANTGEVTLTESADYEVQNQYNFAVIATDSAGNASEALDVILSINNLDEVAPTILSGETASPVIENTPAGQVVYTSTAEDISDISDGVTFSLKDTDSSQFSIDAVTGEVIFSQISDYETTNNYSFTVVATDGADLSSEQLVSLAITNVDDTAPVFTSSATADAIDENTIVVGVYSAQATDDEADIISEPITYSLSDDSNGAFTIDSVTGEVTLTLGLDGDALDSSDASDSSDTLESVVSIPELVADTQHVYVSESTKSEDDTQAIVKVSYNADDSTLTGLGLRIHFDSSALSLSDISDVLSSDLFIPPNTTATADAEDFDNDASTDSYVLASWTSLFGSWPNSVPADLMTLTFDIVDGATGLSPINFTSSSNAAGFAFDGQQHNVAAVEASSDTGNLYSFTVVATDGEDNESSQIVSLLVNDIDDAAPVITSGDTAISVVENSPVGQVIYTATADDSADLNDGAALVFGLAGADADAFIIDSSTGEVTLNVSPDYDIQETYSFTVTATDSVNLVGEKAVTMQVSNLIDGPPTFTSSTVAEIEENIGADQVIYTAVAQSDGENSEVTYSLVANNLYFYEIGALEQAFVNNNDGTYTMQLSIDESVAASYQGELTNFDVSIFYNNNEINPLDENSYTFPLPNLAFDTVNFPTIIDTEKYNEDFVELAIAQVYFPDPGSISSGPIIIEISFSFAPGVSSAQFDISNVLVNDSFEEGIVLQDSSARIFDDVSLSIDENTGEVTLLSNPDYEAQSAYSFTVTATDDLGSREQLILVNVLDRDDSAPIITSSSSADSIDENSGAGQVVYTAEANFSAATFSLTDDSNGFFTIDANTGEVTLSEDPDFEATASYNFTVVSSLDGLDSLERVVTLGVNDIDEDAPVISLSDSIVTVNENSGAGQVVNTATANESVTFSLSGVDAAALSIDSEGAITLIENPDYESGKTSYSYIVVATDDAGNVSEQAASIVVSDADDAAPIISLVDSAVTIDENIGAGQVINTASANESVTFSLSGADAAAFSIDSEGAITLIENPDYESGKTSYSFNVVATDDAGNVSEQTVSVTVNNIDDTVPVFTSSVLNNSIDDNSGSGQIIYTAQASDETSSVSYSLSGPDAAKFDIDVSSGVITLIDNPSYQEQSQYAFDVIATDLAGNISQPLPITLAINELPMITSSPLSVVLEESGSDQVVYTATSNIDGATFSLVDSTVYPTIAVDAEPAVTVVTIPALIAGTQHVYVSESTKSEDGTQAIVKVSYNADDSTLTGLGLRIHYDSSVFTLSEISDVLSSDLFIPPTTTATADAENFDNDASTDNYILASWTSLFGSWPNSVPADLMTMTFDIAAGASGLSAINFTSSSNAAGFAFDGQQHNVAAVEASSDASDSSDTLESVVSIPELVAGTQHVYVSESTKSEDGTQAIVKVSYNADDSTLTGLGLRIHYDSSVFTLSEISDVLSSDLFIPPTTTATADAEDFDNDASTDSYVLASWTSLFGSWPNSVPADLMTLTFDIADDASGSSTINLTSSSNAAGFAFDGQSHEVAISAESESSESSEAGIMASQLSIDSNSGEVTLAGEADYQTVPDYNFTVTADNGTDSASQTVGLLVADQLVSSGADVYTGTDDADVFALADGSAQVTSGAGADIFVIAPSEEESADTSAMHTLVDFESGVDSIDISAALALVGYSSESVLTQMSDDDIPADILDLINADDSSLDNMFGGAFDDTSNVLTLFVDSDAEVGATQIESVEIELGDSSVINEDDIVVSFIA